MRITIYDVAKSLNISASTVSRALNNLPSVREETKSRILEAASEMGYRCNTTMKNIRRYRSNSIGVLIPKIDTYYYSSIIAGMGKIANEAGFNLIINQSMESIANERVNAKSLFNSKIEGLLVSLSSSSDDLDHFQPFLERKIPVIFYDRIAEHKNCTGIIIDNFLAAYKVTEHLIEQGCRRIWHLTGNLKRKDYSDRLKGYKYALMDYGLQVPEPLLVKDLNEETGANAAKHILEMDSLPDGIFVSDDTCAVSIIKALKRAGISIPRDVAVVGFNNEPISRVVEPNLTTVEYPAFEMGQVAMRNMINHLDGFTDLITTNTIILRSSVIVRESSLKKEVQKASLKLRFLP